MPTDMEAKELLGCPDVTPSPTWEEEVQRHSWRSPHVAKRVGFDAQTHRLSLECKCGRKVTVVVRG